MSTVAYPTRRPHARQRALRRNGLLVLLALLAVFVVLGIITGTTSIPLADTWDAIVAFDPADSDHLLVRHLRIPRTLLGIVVGCALGVAGTIMQALTRNPLADPGILGVNAGATVAIAAAISFFGVTTVSGYMWFGLAGAALAGAAVYLLGGVGRGTHPVRVVLAGAALTVVLLALTQVILVNSEEAVFDRFRHWMVGSLQGRGYDVLIPVVTLVAAGLLLAAALARLLDAAALGHDLSRALGAQPLRVWALSAVAVIVLAGAATAAAGPIGFVGLTAPHIARFVAGADHRWVLPYSMLISAVLVVAADTLGRVVAPPGEVGVGIMVALMGGPFFVALVRRRRLVQL
ncbi:iron ABC transporter permease [Nocardia puris]|nr:iron ABC transporter permease [Nocardia puris]MBF6215299.1 iron ABC transporter permease [Nocardia puris]MBF6364240.1 iron ABC transporter permease [Nocardia puris]MBF6459169.1 iron ABC transporter permease [Nocardia puris]